MSGPRTAFVVTTSPLAISYLGEAGRTLPARTVASYTPVVNDTVAVDSLDGGLLIILGGSVASSTPTAQNVYLKSPNGTVYRLTVTDSGVLGTSTNL